MAFADVEVEPAAHGRAAQEVVEQNSGSQLGAVDRKGAASQYGVALVGIASGALHRLVSRGRTTGRHRPGAQGGNIRREAVQQFFKAFGRNAAHRGKHHVGGHVVGIHKTQDLFPGKRLQGFLGTQNVVAQGMPCKEQFFEFVENQFRRGIQVGVDFVGNDLLLFAQFFFRKNGPECDVQQDIQGSWVVVSQKTGVHGGVFLAGVGIEFPSCVLDLGEQVKRLAADGAFEEQVLNEVGQTGLVGAFVPGAGADNQGDVARWGGRLLVHPAQPARENSRNPRIGRHCGCSHWLSQPKNSVFQTIAFWGLSTQCPSAGKYTKRLGTLRSWAAW